MTSSSIRITEFDSAEKVSNVYVQSSAGGDAKGMSRADVIVSMLYRVVTWRS
jgi:hypothetical protein